LRGREVQDNTLQRFIELEHAGWKGTQGSSLRSNPHEEAFFLEMPRAFRQDGDLFFTELRLDGEVIASTCNLVAGQDGFAFKVCFDPRHARRSPGILNELGFLKGLERPVDHFRFIDSGSEPGSFIEQLWPDRTPLHSGTLALGAFARTAARTAQTLSRLRRRFTGRLPHPDSTPDTTP
ncbi:MAG: GNAT family N-acetyltransferase, partial [Rubrivivax sp.]